MPGVLPVINKQAIKYTIMTALALNCTITPQTSFDRKNYPYPDLMKGYQISQYSAPVGCNGRLSIDNSGSTKDIGITRVHLEEDVAKLLHRHTLDGESYSLVDVNRSGIPLMEIVSEPDLRSADEARIYMVKLRSILRYLGVSTGNMEEGSFRCDANISIRPEEQDKSLPKVEVKNMNSFKAVYKALEYEATRQRKVAGEGKRLVQETRGWLEDKGKTISQRSKEYAHDYRYFPEPDLPPLVLNQEWISEIKADLPELPDTKRNRFIYEFGLPIYDADLLTSSKEMADYEESFIKTEILSDLSLKEKAKLGSNWILGEVSRLINAHGIDVTDFRRIVNPEKLAELSILNKKSTINMATAKRVLEEMFNTGKNAQGIIEKHGLNQIVDGDVIQSEIIAVIKNNDVAVNEYKTGKEQVLKFLIGQVMKATKGRAEPKLVEELLKKKLKGD
jgi:aspartyl-tRNA(Asn)/glutamyl-tRNA(Gln) amidotransferase subunit B